MTHVLVKVPATTANLGPGFDCLGIALKVYNTVSVQRGKGSTDADGMIAAAGEAFFHRAKRRLFAFQCSVAGGVPRSRGMGSSVTVRLGVLHGLNALAEAPLNREEIFELCAELEGHPDNAAPAAFGGFTIARRGAEFQRYRVSEKLSFVLLIPDFCVATADARKALPENIPLGDAVISAANACAIAGAFASRDYAKLAGCFEDRLHQPYRKKLVPGLEQVIAAGEKAGALGGWLSGSGSTIACLTLGSPEKVARAMSKAADFPGASVLIIKADNVGARVSIRS